MALNASLIWEVRQAGSANNGGAFRHNPFQAAPAIPAVTGSGSGGTVAAGTYYCVITYTPGVRGETEISPQQSVTLSGTTSSFTVTHPTDPGNGATWNLYVATTSGGPYFPQGTALAIGSNRVVTTTPPTTGTQPPGVDRTLSTSPTVAIDNSTITTSITTNVITFTAGYTPTGADVGNVVHMLTGTNVTVGWYEITGITSTTWTVDRNVVTSGTTTNATGNMGGASDTLATICNIAANDNTIYVKYSATAYTFSSAGQNVSGGTVHTNGTGLYVVGYDATRTVNNTDANRPIFKPVNNALLMCYFNSTQNIYNLDFVNPTPQTGITGIQLGGNCLVRNCRFTAMNQIAIQTGGGCTVMDCEFISCGSTQVTLLLVSASNAVRCIAKACSTAGSSSTVFLANSGTGTSFIDCVSYGATGSGNAFNGGGTVQGCVAYGSASGVNAHGFLTGSETQYDRCIAYGNTGYGFRSTGANNYTILTRCFAGNNTVADFDTTRYGPDQFVGCGTLSGDPFTNAAGYDFSTNTTAGAGALLRGLTVGFPGGTTTSHPDAGAAQHADAPGGGAMHLAGRGGGLVA